MEFLTASQCPQLLSPSLAGMLLPCAGALEAWVGCGLP